MKTRLLLFLLLACAFRDSVARNPYYFTRLGVEDGLAQNTVSCILQDRTGFLWFGTKDGLNRYDGTRFKTFRRVPGNPHAIGSNFIRALYEDADGTLWVGTNAGLYLYDPRTERFRAFAVRTADGRRIDNEVNDIRCDGSGRLWICVNWQGLFRYDPAKDELNCYACDPGDDGTISSDNPWSVCFDADGTPWLGCHGGGLNRYDSLHDRFVRYPLPGGADIYKVVADSRGGLLVGTANDGLYAFDPDAARFRPLLAREGLRTLYVRDIFFRSDREVWLGTESGIYIWDRTSQRVQHLEQEYADPWSLSSNAVYAIYRDQEGALWIGTYFGGVNYLPAPTSFFEKHFPTGHPESLSGKAVREFAEDADGRIWVGTEDAGLNLFDPASGRFTHFDHRNGRLPFDNVHALLADGDRLYFGTFNGGLNVLDRRTGRIVTYRKRPGPGSLTDDNVFSLCRDRQGVLWVGTIYGLNTFDPATGRFRQVEAIGERPFIFDIFEADDETLYFAAYNQGVYTYNRYLDAWKRIECPGMPEELLRHVIGIGGDSAGNLWFGTEGMGLVRYDPATGEVRTLTTQDGLPNDVVYKAVEDTNRNLWITTNKGLVRYDPVTGEMKVFTSKDGLTSDQFNYKSGFRAADGKLYFGTIAGFVSFRPERFITAGNLSPVVLTDLRFADGPPEVGAKGSPLRCAMPCTHSIRLRHGQATFSVSFSLLSYHASDRNRYRYLMRNYGSEWATLESNRPITFYNMPPGRYTLEIQGANSDGIWNESPARLDIEIVAPWYASRLALLGYAALACLSVGFVARRYVRRSEQRERQLMEEQRIARERADYRARIDFFTNITHEIRTPLSLIKGPYEQIVRPDTSAEDYRENLEIMGANIERLLNLSNQLLDFRKTESPVFPVRRTSTDVGQLLEKCCRQFAQSVRCRERRLELHLPAERVSAVTDAEALTKIVCNLIDNAVKFAAGRIDATLETDPAAGCFSIRIANDGEPVPDDLRERIFEPFFQIGGSFRAGTGLGLPLVRRLAEQQGGGIRVTREEEMTVFRVELPWVVPEKDAASVSDAAEPARRQDEGRDEPGNEVQTRYSLLIVEDDRGMQSFLRRIFAAQYTVRVASDAQQALRILDSDGIDLILSDVVMPGMDGVALCRMLKARIEYCHIPIVLLSAKSDVASKVEGLGAGADAYVEKPFSCDYLLAQVATILQNLLIVKNSFMQQPLAGLGAVARGHADRDFLERIDDIILRNLDDEQFNLDRFAGELRMSRSSLHRKIKGLTRMTPNDLIRLVRLKKAAEMLLGSDYRVNEICYMVGFSSPSYFARCFQRQFGVLPKEFAKNRKG